MIRYAEFCAGIGGFTLGISESNFDSTCVYINEINKKCENTYSINFNANFDSYDIFDVDIENIPDFDILCSGFPCQPFSIAGKQKGFNDSRGLIFFKLIEIITFKRPKAVFLENVPNLKSHQKGKTFEYMISELQKLNYNVYNKVIDSKYFGVPQSRPRCYIVAIQNKFSKKFSFPLGNGVTKYIKDIINIGDNSIPVSDKWNFYIDLYQKKINIDEVPFNIPKTRKSLERVSKNCDLFDCVLQMRSSGVRAYSIDTQFPTFAVSVSGGGAMIPILTKERRHLSLLEMKRLMGFPDTFKFLVSRTDSIKQLANAVCPPVISAIYNNLCSCITDVDL